MARWKKSENGWIVNTTKDIRVKNTGVELVIETSHQPTIDRITSCFKENILDISHGEERTIIILNKTDLFKVTMKDDGLKDNVRESKTRMNSVREKALEYAISGDGSPIFGSLPPDNNKNYSAYVDFKLDQEANKYKD